MSDEVPRCRVCGKAPFEFDDGIMVAHHCYVTRDNWRRLHGPRLAPEEVLHLRACAKWHEDTERLWAAAIRAALAALREE
jgi:hypothetical protein